MAYSWQGATDDDLPRQWLRVNEPPPPIAQAARNRGLTPLQAYLRLLERDRIDLDNEIKQLAANR